MLLTEVLRDLVALSSKIFSITFSLLLYTTSVLLILLRSFGPYISAIMLLLKEDIWLRGSGSLVGMAI